MLVLIIGIFFSISILKSQTGTLRGTIIDLETGETLIGATVLVDGTSKGTITDFDGNYTLILEPGTYTIKISFISYETKVFPDVVIKADEVSILDANLGVATSELGEVVVEARLRRKTEAAMMVMQKKSASLLDGISSEQMSKLADSDAASALKRVTGVSVQGGKYVFVRGLGDRYTKITLNGAEIPGLDPEKNTVQMDIFPSNIIENIVVHKTFTPDLPGESTGGHVDVVTKDFPEKYTLMFSTSLGFNPQVHLNDNFLSYDGGKTDWIGIDDGTRDVPTEGQEALDEIIANNSNQINTSSFSKTELNTISNSFNKNMDVKREKSFLDHSHKFAVGNQVNLAGKPLGFNIALSYSRDYDYYSNGKYSLNNDPNYDKNSNQYTQPIPHISLADERGTENVALASLINMNYKLSNNHKLGIRYIRNQSGKTVTRYRQGVFNYENTDAQDINLGFLERNFDSYQLHGKHVFPAANGLVIKWLGSYTLMKQNEPDLRFWTCLVDSTTHPDTPFRLKTNDTPARFYREMEEANLHAKVDFDLPVSMFGTNTKIKFGGAYVYKDRDLSERKFALNYTTTLYDGDIEKYLTDRIYSENFSLLDGAYYYTADYESNLINSYTAYQAVLSEYAMIDIPLEKFRIVTGLRVEQSTTFVENKINSNDAAYKKGEKTYNDFLPSLNCTYKPVDNMNVRFAVSQTIARPVFKEIGTDYYDYKSSIFYTGNENLERSKILNGDLRWEYFPKSTDKFAVSFFYKSFENPIEQTLDISQAQNFKVLYINPKNATLYGTEIEMRKKLDFVSFLENFTVGGNFTYVISQVEKTKEVYDLEVAGDPDREETRPMFGQAPWIVNAFLSYSHDSLGLSSNIGFNVTGEKLYMITLGGTPYLYEQPGASLNWNISKQLGENWSIDFAVKNILDSEYYAVYHYNTGDKYHLKYKSGRVFSFGFKYLIN